MHMKCCKQLHRRFLGHDAQRFHLHFAQPHRSHWGLQPFENPALHLPPAHDWSPSFQSPTVCQTWGSTCPRLSAKTEHPDCYFKSATVDESQQFHPPSLTHRAAGRGGCFDWGLFGRHFQPACSKEISFKSTLAGWLVTLILLMAKTIFVW